MSNGYELKTETEFDDGAVESLNKSEGEDFGIVLRRKGIYMIKVRYILMIKFLRTRSYSLDF